ncbi:right-handed parallel beta-helix repeat-containing protein, partial [Candidatus Aerophobetes bacterium]|nr:right-handed parallel beta-helix repeat-containing protein [Candidatus Aerophobetes bacterium]
MAALSYSIVKRSVGMIKLKSLRFLGLGIIGIGVLIGFTQGAAADVVSIENITKGITYATIQQAVDAASAGDTIQISGDVTHPVTENVTINVSNLTIQASPGTQPLITASDSSTDVFCISAASVTISGLTVSGATNAAAGIKVNSVNNCQILNNTVTNNSKGIYLYSTSGTTVSGNNVSNNTDEGIFLDDSNNATITGNNISGSNYGIYLGSSDYNTLLKNNISNNSHGIYFSSSDNNRVLGNTISNNESTFPSGIHNDSNSDNNFGYYNNISGNLTYGVWSEATFDAKHNWWGAKDGPGENGPGSGDKVSTNVSYDPWLGASVTDLHYESNVNVINNTNTIIDATNEADTILSISGSTTIDVYVAKLSGNPKTAFSGFMNKFIDVHLS